jgi:predicted porin
MKKSLIALAVLAASGIASAQSTVTLYGLLDANINSTKSGGLTQTKVDSGGVQTSRFGFKGSEDLGGGLKANFVLESGINIDTGATRGNLFNRQSYVGFSGGFGEVKIGKMWTPFDDVQGLGAAAFNANIFAPAAYVWLSNDYQANPGNSIYYVTPDVGGFSGAAMYRFGENKTAAVSAGKDLSFRVGYEGGPLAAALAYQTEKANGAVARTTKFTQINASYDLGVAKLLAAYGNVKDGAAPKTNEYQFGADFPVTSALVLSAGYATSKDTGLAAEIKRKGLGLGALYTVSKRTNLYLGLNSSKTTQAAAPDLKTDVFALGVRHTF